ncbi:hypothetical protein HDV05_004409 [Chytridiales sp. JEL 0842]|nr:hypothetical protein HDV05_004409 [Chytridiales sp. JEL 0842]
MSRTVLQIQNAIRTHFPPWGHCTHHTCTIERFEEVEEAELQGFKAIVWVSRVGNRLDEVEKGVLERLKAKYGPQRIIPISTALVRAGGTPSGWGVGTRLVFEGGYDERGLDLGQYRNGVQLQKICEDLSLAVSN